MLVSALFRRGSGSAGQLDSYQLEGRVEFANTPHEAKQPLPHMKLDQQAEPVQQAREPRTVLVRRDGLKFSKRCGPLSCPVTCLHAVNLSGQGD